MQTLERNHITHFDSKPANFMDGQWIDLGEVKTDDQPAQSYTPAYAAPEFVKRRYQEDQVILTPDEHKGFTRFGLGMTIIQAITDRLPLHCSEDHFLFLPMDDGGAHDRGFLNDKVVSKDDIQTFSQLEQQLLRYAKQLANDDIAIRNTVNLDEALQLVANKTETKVETNTETKTAAEGKKPALQARQLFSKRYNQA